MKMTNPLPKNSPGILKEFTLELAEKIRKHAQSVYIRRELAKLETRILEDIGMDEETLKRRKEAGCRSE